MTKENPRGGGNLSLRLGKIYSLCNLGKFTMYFPATKKLHNPAINKLISSFPS